MWPIYRLVGRQIPLMEDSSSFDIASIVTRTRVTKVSGKRGTNSR